MDENRTTFAVQGFLDELARAPGSGPAEAVVRMLLARSVARLQLLCGTMLYRSYPRLTQPPLNLEADELLGAVVERLLKAMRDVRPHNVRQFFALANQHMRWELNDLARRLDERPRAVPLQEDLAPAAQAQSSGSQLSPDARRILEAIEALPEDEREVFGLIRIQGMSYPEAAEVLGVSPKTVQRRLNRGLLLLTGKLADLTPSPDGPPPA